MKFIFPKNYNFKTKLFGVIDYTTVFLNFLWYIFVLFIVNLIFSNLNLKIFVFIIFCFPLLLFSFSGFNGENIFCVISYMSKFILKQKLMLFEKK